MKRDTEAVEGGARAGLTVSHRGRRLCIGFLPGRTRPSLYFADAMNIRPVASFVSERAADAVVAFIEAGANEGARIVWQDRATPTNEESVMSEHDFLGSPIFPVCMACGGPKDDPAHYKPCIYCGEPVSSGDVCERCAFEGPPLTKAERRREARKLRERNDARRRGT